MAKTNRFRTLIFIINYLVLLGSCILGFKSFNFGFFGLGISYFGAGLALVCLSIAIVLHSCFPKKHEEASDFGNLQTTGFYRYVRHPFYSILIVLNYAVSLAFLSHYAVILSSLLLPAWWYLAKTEEKDLVQFWGQRYMDYQKSVPMFLPKLKTKEKTKKT